MTSKLRYAEDLKVLPLLGPLDIAASATASKYIDLKYLNWATIFVQFGAMTSDATDTCTITVEASTASASNATETAIAFKYRLSAAVDTDTMGAITDATSSGVAHPATGDNKMYVIDVDPAVVETALASGTFLRVVLTPNAEMATCNVGVIAVGEPRYPGNSQPSST